MSIQIIYTDIFGSPVTEQQQNMPHDFKKMTFISNEIKTIEIFENVGRLVINQLSTLSMQLRINRI